MKRRTWLLIGSLVGFLAGVFPGCQGGPEQYDLAIVNGQIIDGSGNPWFRADLGIKDQKIVAIKNKIPADQAKKVIDASGLIVAPGFIDIHTHADEDLIRIPGCENYVSQGVTTLIGGNCGGHEFPLASLFDEIKKPGIACNFASLAGHNTIRRQVMGMKMGEPDSEEMARMKDLLRQEMAAGAMGLSTGLSYLPGTYSKTAELVELASVVAEYGGFYASHIRNQGKNITAAIEEAIKIGEENNLPVEISHIKLADEDVWNQLDLITRPVEAARARGVEVTLDQYPYTATSSGFASSFPQDVFEGGHEKFLERLKDPETYERIKKTIIANRLTSGRGIDKLEAILIARCQKFPEYEGKNLKEILARQGKPASAETGADLIIELVKEGDASAIFFQMDEKDVEALMKLPYVMIGSDGGLEKVGVGSPHPRSYGTLARVLREYVRERQILGLEEAIRKMTSLPAQTLRLLDRGLIKTGFFADVVIFNPEEVKDQATFANPHQYSRGMVSVIVNGQEVLAGGQFTGQRPGQILYGQGYRPD